MEAERASGAPGGPAQEIARRRVCILQQQPHSSTQAVIALDTFILQADILPCGANPGRVFSNQNFVLCVVPCHRRQFIARHLLTQLKDPK